MKVFAKPDIDTVIKKIDDCLRSKSSTPIAAFDADGTLWANDMGEGLFRLQIEERLIADLPENAWDYYLKMQEDISPEEAFLWLAQINAGYSLSQVRQWAKKAVEKLGRVPTFPYQQRIVRHLLERGVDVYIVTASVKWAVDPAAEIYGIPESNVIGIATKVRDGIVTDEQDGVITYREGKVEGLLRATRGQYPFYCSGNTTGDLPLLEAATDLRMVIGSAAPGHVNHEKERQMIQLAKNSGWCFQDYLDGYSDLT